METRGKNDKKPLISTKSSELAEHIPAEVKLSVEPVETKPISIGTLLKKPNEFKLIIDQGKHTAQINISIKRNENNIFSAYPPLIDPTMFAEIFERAKAFNDIPQSTLDIIFGINIYPSAEELKKTEIAKKNIKNFYFQIAKIGANELFDPTIVQIKTDVALSLIGDNKGIAKPIHTLFSFIQNISEGIIHAYEREFQMRLIEKWGNKKIQNYEKLMDLINQFDTGNKEIKAGAFVELGLDFSIDEYKENKKYKEDFLEKTFGEDFLISYQAEKNLFNNNIKKFIFIKNGFQQGGNKYCENGVHSFYPLELLESFSNQLKRKIERIVNKTHISDSGASTRMNELKLIYNSIDEIERFKNGQISIQTLTAAIGKLKIASEDYKMNRGLLSSASSRLSKRTTHSIISNLEQELRKLLSIEENNRLDDIFKAVRLQKEIGKEQKTKAVRLPSASRSNITGSIVKPDKKEEAYSHKTPDERSKSLENQLIVVFENYLIGKKIALQKKYPGNIQLIDKEIKKDKQAAAVEATINTLVFLRDDPKISDAMKLVAIGKLLENLQKTDTNEFTRILDYATELYSSVDSPAPSVQLDQDGPEFKKLEEQFIHDAHSEKLIASRLDFGIIAKGKNPYHAYMNPSSFGGEDEFIVIQNIETVDNPELLRKYDIAKSKIKTGEIDTKLVEGLVGLPISKELDSTINELYLYHGCSLPGSRKISQSGFNAERFCGYHTLRGYGPLGRGTYFTDKLPKAGLYAMCAMCGEHRCACMTADSNLIPKVVLICKVQLGNPEVVTEKTRSIMHSTNPASGFDSRIGIGKKINPKSEFKSNEIAIATDAQIYPQYRVLYHHHKNLLNLKVWNIEKKEYGFDLFSKSVRRLESYIIHFNKVLNNLDGTYEDKMAQIIKIKQVLGVVLENNSENPKIQKACKIILLQSNHYLKLFSDQWQALRGGKENIHDEEDEKNIDKRAEEKSHLIEELLASPEILDEEHPRPQGSGWQQLVLAAWDGDEKKVDLLLETVTEINKANNVGVTPLYAAVQNGHIKVVNILLEQKNINPNMSIEADIEILIAEAKKNNKHLILQELIASKGIETKTIEGFNPIHAGAFFGHFDIVKSLISSGVDLNARTQGNITAVEFAKIMDNKLIENLLNHAVKYTRPPDTIRAKAFRKLCAQEIKSQDDFTRQLATFRLMDALSQEKNPSSEKAYEDYIKGEKAHLIIDQLKQSLIVESKSSIDYVNEEVRSFFILQQLKEYITSHQWEDICPQIVVKQLNRINEAEIESDWTAALTAVIAMAKEVGIKNSIFSPINEGIKNYLEWFSNPEILVKELSQALTKEKLFKNKSYDM